MSTHQPELQAARLAAIVADFTARVKELWAFSHDHTDLSLADLETKARELSRDCFAAPLEVALAMQRPAVEDVRHIDAQPCACGQPWRNKGTQERTVLSMVGPVSVRRTYYYCNACRQGRYPLDEALGLGAERCSDGVQQAVCLLGTQMAFVPAAATLAALTTLSVSAREVERLTEARGATLEQHKRAEQQQLLAGGPQAEALVGQWQQAAKRQPPVAGRWAVALDAAKALFVDDWHEIKAGVVFRAVPQPAADGPPGTWAGAVARQQSYIAEVGNIAAAAARLSAEAWRRGIGAEEEVICLGDGAAGNWNQFAMHFPRRIEVLDWYHAVEHLWTAGNGMFGEGSAGAGNWVRAREKELWDGDVEGVLAALGAAVAEGGARGAVAGEQVHYFSTNRVRMRYNEYRAAGYPLGSGTVESTCKRLIGGRIKGAGMRWSKAGAQAVLTLRAELLSERWEESWPATRTLAKAA